MDTQKSRLWKGIIPVLGSQNTQPLPYFRKDKQDKILTIIAMNA